MREGPTFGQRVYLFKIFLESFYFSDKNHTISDKIMASIREVLGMSGFQFLPNNARIITGQTEGSSGWIAVNYLQKYLQQNKVFKV